MIGHRWGEEAERASEQSHSTIARVLQAGRIQRAMAAVLPLCLHCLRSCLCASAAVEAGEAGRHCPSCRCRETMGAGEGDHERLTSGGEGGTSRQHRETHHSRSRGCELNAATAARPATTNHGKQQSDRSSDEQLLCPVIVVRRPRVQRATLCTRCDEREGETGEEGTVVQRTGGAKARASRHSLASLPPILLLLLLLLCQRVFFFCGNRTGSR